MPEGDTVWRTARRLSRLDGQRLTSADLRIPSLATRDLSGVRVLGTLARGKHLLTRFDNDATLHSHLKMEGAWSVQAAGTRWRRPAYTARAVLRTETTEAVGFQIVLELIPTVAEAEAIGHLGPDLLGTDWDLDTALVNLLRDPAVPIGEALLEQRNLAGIGNIYRCELCFLSGVDPQTPVGDLPDLPRLLRRAHQLLFANRDRAERITTGDARRGRQLWVYGRRGPCLRCSEPIRREQQGPPGRERTTYWCPRCQPVIARS